MEKEYNDFMGRMNSFPMNFDTPSQKNELAHVGVLGMKWGIRRKNPKSSTIKREASRFSIPKRKPKGWDYSDDAKGALEIRQKKLGQMTNVELRKVNERRQMETQYKQLNKTRFETGVAYVAAATTLMGTAIAFYNHANTTVKIGKTILGKNLTK